MREPQAQCRHIWSPAVSSRAEQGRNAPRAPLDRQPTGGKGLKVPAMCSAGTDGQYLHGWERQFDFLSSKWAGVPQSDRLPQVMWRGRTEDAEFPKRDAMR